MTLTRRSELHCFRGCQNRIHLAVRCALGRSPLGYGCQRWLTGCRAVPTVCLACPYRIDKTKFTLSKLQLSSQPAARTLTRTSLRLASEAKSATPWCSLLTDGAITLIHHVSRAHSMHSTAIREPILRSNTTGDHRHLSAHGLSSQEFYQMVSEAYSHANQAASYSNSWTVRPRKVGMSRAVIGASVLKAEEGIREDPTHSKSITCNS